MYGLTLTPQMVQLATNVPTTSTSASSSGLAVGPATVTQQSLSTALDFESTVGAMMEMKSIIELAKTANVSQALQLFIASNPNAQQMEEAYATKSLVVLKDDIFNAKVWSQQIGNSIKTSNDNLNFAKNRLEADPNLYNSIIDMIGELELQIAELQATRSLVNSFVQYAQAYYDLREYEGKEKKADEKAIARGYENAEQAKALREVEIEWYYMTYGIFDPIEILALQKIERKTYGTTSYKAAMDGKTLQPLGNQAQQQALADALVLKEELLLAEQDKKRKYMIYGGSALAVSLLGFLVYRRMS